MTFLRIATIAAWFALAAGGLPAQAAQVLIVSGDMQVAAVGEPIPKPLAIRLTADDGSPIAGADVIFFIDQCNETQGVAEGRCPPPTAYPRLAGDRWFVHVRTDAHGLATSPALRAGLGIGTFQIAARAVDFSNESARFQVIQRAGPELPIDAGMSGMWIDTAHSGQGLLLEVLDDGRLLAFWIGFRPDGDGLAWFGGDAAIENNIATLEMRMAEGGPDPANIAASPWGYLVVRFPDCNRALVDYWSYDRAWGEGSKVLARLTRVAGTSCSPADARRHREPP